VSRVRGLPPGRAGRTWLAGRLSTARRGAGLLDRKLRILRREQERAAAEARRTRALWAEQLAEAERWGLRAALLGGADALQAAADPDGGGADVEVTWSAVMGARFPGEARLRLPDAGADSTLPSTAAVTCAAVAYRQALAAAVDAAVAEAAARLVDAEIATTRLRVRAVEDRWIPRLEAASTELALRLAEAEGAEAVRLRLARPGTRR
jgi:V/A-type H+/Na+-transporting ATPase subunit D